MVSFTNSPFSTFLYGNDNYHSWCSTACQMANDLYHSLGYTPLTYVNPIYRPVNLKYKE